MPERPIPASDTDIHEVIVRIITSICNTSEYNALVAAGAIIDALKSEGVALSAQEK